MKIDYFCKYIKIKLMENGKMPAYQRDGDACLDCYSAEDITIRKGSRSLVKLGFALELPANCEAVIRPRSGLTKRGIDCGIGTIDSTYRGEVMANIINNADDDFIIHFGDRVCQLSINEIKRINFQQVEILNDTQRGADGFGSSGI